MIRKLVPEIPQQHATAGVKSIRLSDLYCVNFVLRIRWETLYSFMEACLCARYGLLSLWLEMARGDHTSVSLRPRLCLVLLLVQHALKIMGSGYNSLHHTRPLVQFSAASSGQGVI